MGPASAYKKSDFIFQNQFAKRFSNLANIKSSLPLFKFNMKLIIALALLVAVAAADKLPTGRQVAILRSLNEAKDDGSFNYNFESEDGIKVEATGSQKLVGPKPEDIGTVQRGSYSYVAPDGTPITVNWVADENGYQATGAHLPVAPPMPDHVVKMLADLRAQGRL